MVTLRWKQKSPVSRALCFVRGVTAPRLQRLDVGRGRTLLALRHVEGDLLALFERLVAVHLDRAVMGEQILAAVIRRDESEALGVVEPLHGACRHVSQFLETKRLSRLSEPRYGHDDQGRELT